MSRNTTRVNPHFTYYIPKFWCRDRNDNGTTKVKEEKSGQRSVITRQITKLGETEDMDHFQTIMKSLQTKYAALVDLNENILALTDEDDYETEMVDTEDFHLSLAHLSVIYARDIGYRRYASTFKVCLRSVLHVIKL